MTEREIRAAVLLWAAREQDRALILEEVAVGCGVGRIDVLAVGEAAAPGMVEGWLHGYEIKSEADTCRRLATQVPTFSLVFDRVTLCVDAKHEKEALAKSPGWWGVEVFSWLHGAAVMRTARFAHDNPGEVAAWQMHLLWREELEALATRYDMHRGMRKLSKPRLAARILAGVGPAQLRHLVRLALRQRPEWWRLRQPKPETP